MKNSLISLINEDILLLFSTKNFQIKPKILFTTFTLLTLLLFFDPLNIKNNKDLEHNSKSLLLLS